MCQYQKIQQVYTAVHYGSIHYTYDMIGVQKYEMLYFGENLFATYFDLSNATAVIGTDTTTVASLCLAVEIRTCRRCGVVHIFVLLRTFQLLMLQQR